MVQNPLNNSDIQQEIDDLENSINTINTNFNSNVWTIINNTLFATASDLNTVDTLSCFTDGNTLNTPFKQGLTQGQQAFVITGTWTATSSYCTQLAIVIDDNKLYTRRKGPQNGWREWVAIS